MSKKTRGTARTTRHRRPGARPATSRSGAGRGTREAQPDQVGLAPAQPVAEPAQATAGALTAEASEPSSSNARLPVTRSHPRQRAKPGSLLAARAATEYVYVTQDLKRISVVGVLLFGALILLWLAVVVFRLVPLPFY